MSNIYGPSRPTMPGKFDTVYAEIRLRDGYSAIAFDSDPYVMVTVLEGDQPLFTVGVASYKSTMDQIEANIEQYVAEVASKVVP